MVYSVIYAFYSFYFLKTRPVRRIPCICDTIPENFVHVLKCKLIQTFTHRIYISRCIKKAFSTSMKIQVGNHVIFILISQLCIYFWISTALNVFLCLDNFSARDRTDILQEFVFTFLSLKQRLFYIIIILIVII